MATCRFCKKPVFNDQGGVKYGVRHYAHGVCYLNAGKRLEDLRPYELKGMSFRLLRDRGLLSLAEKLTKAAGY